MYHNCCILLPVFLDHQINKMSSTITVKQKVTCTHCGDLCIGSYPKEANQNFCCEGCKTVYHLLSQNGMSQYYDLNYLPGISRKRSEKKDFNFLSESDIENKIIQSSIGGIVTVIFNLPAIHCSSCIWLLENLYKINEGVKSAQVNFLKKEVIIQFDKNKLKLAELAAMLDFIGYTPDFSLASTDSPISKPSINRSQWLKIGVAGFCFGNIMLLSFPDYLGAVQEDIAFYFRWLLIFFSLPVVFYSGREYLVSAWKKIRMFSLGVDVPIAIGIITLFSRSIYEIIAGTGVGYLDSLAGFIFFLLIGKSFQEYTLQTISFDRDFKSYFPISTLVKKGGKWVSASLQAILKDQIILVKNHEVIPCDSMLLSESSKIDYSFVTGESRLVSTSKGNLIYAGGRHYGPAIQLKVVKQVSQSYLTSLWNQNKYDKSSEKPFAIIDKIGTYFTLIILSVALGTFLYWFIQEKAISFSAATAVLIIACPCVIALSVPFIYGNALRILPKYGIFVKDIAALATLPKIATIIFDKTGTITDNVNRKVEWQGNELSEIIKSEIKSMALQSGHPLSQTIVQYFDNVDLVPVENFMEYPGFGIEGRVNGETVKLGSGGFIFDVSNDSDNQEVLVEIDNHLVGRFIFENQLRSGIVGVFSKLGKDVAKFLVSGDNARQDAMMTTIFPDKSARLYNQKPHDKLQFVKKVQRENNFVMMVGDGLNDAGALNQSNIGVVIADRHNNFSPACDIIVHAEMINNLAYLISFGHKLKNILIGAFGLAIIYNSVGLFFAVQGLLSPVVAAILMPISSISVILYGVLLSSMAAKQLFTPTKKDNIR
jgi:Cu+-exporting ATPase